MTHTPVIKSVDVQTVRNKVDSVIRGLQQDIRAEVPSPAQQPPYNAVYGSREDRRGK